MGNQQLNTHFRNHLHIHVTTLKRAERVLFKMFMFHLKIIVDFIHPQQMYRNDLHFSLYFRMAHWGWRMILNFKINRVLDEGTINHTFFHACISYIDIPILSRGIQAYVYKYEWKKFSSVYSNCLCFRFDQVLPLWKESKPLVKLKNRTSMKKTALHMMMRLTKFHL